MMPAAHPQFYLNYPAKTTLNVLYRLTTEMGEGSCQNSQACPPVPARLPASHTLSPEGY